MGNISSLSVPRQPAGVATPEAHAEAGATLDGKQAEAVVKAIEDGNVNEPQKVEQTEATKAEGQEPSQQPETTPAAPTAGLPDDLVAQLAAEEQARLKAIEEAEAEAALQQAFADEIAREVAKGTAEYEALQSNNPTSSNTDANDSIIADVSFESAAAAAEANKPVEMVAAVEEPVTPAPEPTPAAAETPAPEAAPAADPNAPPIFDINKFNILTQNPDLMANPEIANFLLSVHQSPELLSNPDVYTFLAALWQQQNP
jgi:hypothetical protein